MRARQSRVVELCRLASVWPPRKGFFDRGLYRRRIHVTSDCHQGAARLEIEFVKCDDVLSGYGFQRLFGHVLPEGVSSSVQELRKDARCDGCSPRSRLREGDEPLSAESFKCIRGKGRIDQHVRENIERLREFTCYRLK